ncbi:MAG: Sterol-binding domain protein [Gammaproteobacteria bacterium]|nr:Sterol-binding domain protein [Gammaproteobacteria bacterium]
MNSILLAASLETAINTVLGLDPEIASQLQQLEDKVILLNITTPDIKFYFLPTDSKIQILSSYEDKPDTRIYCSLFDLLHLSIHGSDKSSLFSTNIEMRGDLETGRQFRDILNAIEIDWEDLLSRVTGDIAAHQIVRNTRKAKAYTQQSAKILGQDLTEYLQEEKRILPTAIQLENFYNDVDQLRYDSDRLEARIKRLQQWAKEKSE